MITTALVPLFAALSGGAPAPAIAPDLARPVRLETDAGVLDIPHDAYAGPLVVDADGDGVRDLVVTGISGTFHLFKNVGTDAAPKLTLRGKVQAKGADIRLHNW